MTVPQRYPSRALREAARLAFPPLRVPPPAPGASQADRLADAIAARLAVGQPQPAQPAASPDAGKASE
jgi:hypothetical protein